MCGQYRQPVLDAVGIVTAEYSPDQRAFRIAPDYEPINVSKKVVRIIASYTDYVNRTVWRKGEALIPE